VIAYQLVKFVPVDYGRSRWPQLGMTAKVTEVAYESAKPHSCDYPSQSRSVEVQE